MLHKIDKLEEINKLPNDKFLPKENIKTDLENNPFGHYLIDVENYKIIAYLYYSDIYERAEINQIEVKVFNRNCGKATKLLKKMIELVDKNITLEVKKDNIPAINLYKKFNFKEKAMRKGYYQGIDGILMEREQDR